jgi:hypothetical protein
MQANQSQRQSAASSNQSNRQSAASSNQSNRQTSVSNTQNNYYGNSGSCSNCWDGGAVAAGVVAGAVVAGAAASAAAASQPAPTTYVNQAPQQVAPPCNVAPMPVSGVPYYKCGATWYTAGYGSAGVVYMPVPPPPGY